VICKSFDAQLTVADSAAMAATTCTGRRYLAVHGPPCDPIRRTAHVVAAYAVKPFASRRTRCGIFRRWQALRIATRTSVQAVRACA
jgi:hypothetical protein